MDNKTKGYIIAALRKIWRWSQERRKCLKEAKRRKRYQCAKCKKYYLKVQVDHIVPIGGFKNDWNAFIDKLFCSVDNLQSICKKCHSKKTNKERTRR